MAGVSSQGTTVSFGGSTYAATSVRVSNGQPRQRISGAHMGMGVNDFEPMYDTHRTDEERVTVDIEYVAGTVPAINATGTLTISGRLSVSGQATCISSEVTAAVGELVRGTASFRIA